METISLNRKQQRRLEIITRVLGGNMTKEDAAEHLGITRRQVDNILRRFRDLGAASLIHGNTGRVPLNKTPDATVEKLEALAGSDGPYHDFSICHLHDQLSDGQEIIIGRSTVDRILKNKGIRKPRKPHSSIHRTRRQRSAAKGMLVQIDASSHDWLEGRGPRMALMGAVDDATGKILYLEFRPTEDQAGYLRLFRSIAVNYGLPQSYYHDRHTILRSPKEPTIEEELEGKKPQSDIQRVLDALGVGSIAARSPQAKGRIERLWGTLQQRLLREMRVAGVSTMEEANLFLPRFIERFNLHFAKDPADPQSAWVSIQRDMDLDYYFSVCQRRVVRPDHTLRWEHKTLQILRRPGEKSLSRKPVYVHVTPEGAVFLYDGRERLRYVEAAQRPDVVSEETSLSKKKPAKERDPEARKRQCKWLYASP
jgi:transposase